MISNFGFRECASAVWMDKTTNTFHTVEWEARSYSELKDASLANSRTHDGRRGPAAPAPPLPSKVDAERATACDPRECSNRPSTLQAGKRELR